MPIRHQGCYYRKIDMSLSHWAINRDKTFENEIPSAVSSPNESDIRTTAGALAWCVFYLSESNLKKVELSSADRRYIII